MYESYINKIEDVGKLRNLKPKTITLYQKNVSRFLNYIKKSRRTDLRRCQKLSSPFTRQRRPKLLHLTITMVRLYFL